MAFDSKLEGRTFNFSLLESLSLPYSMFLPIGNSGNGKNIGMHASMRGYKIFQLL